MDKIEWNQLSNQELPWVFYEAFADKLNWAIISRTHRLTIEFVRKFKSYLDWDAVSCNGNGLSEEVLIECEDQLNWVIVLHFNELSMVSIRRHKNYLNMQLVAMHQYLDEPFLREYFSELDPLLVSNNQVLSLEFIRDYAPHLFWSVITVSIEMPESFIREMSQYIKWNLLAFGSTLSEAFIRKHISKMDMHGICLYQKLSPKFIDDYEDQIYWENLSRNETIHPDVAHKYIFVRLDTTDQVRKAMRRYYCRLRASQVLSKKTGLPIVESTMMIAEYL
jgi:hypothetical protein